MASSAARARGSANTMRPSPERSREPSAFRTPAPNRAATARRPAVPGATASRASASASMTGTRGAANRARQYDLPVAMPPVNATRSPASALPGPGLRSRQRVFQQERNGQRPDTAGHRGQRARDLGNGRMHVADDDRAALRQRLEPRRAVAEQLLDDGAIPYWRGPHVDDGGAWLHEIPGDEAWPPDRCHENVASRGDRWQVRRLRMTDRYGGVALQKQHGHRFTDDLAAADDDGVAAANRDARAVEQFD